MATHANWVIDSYVYGFALQEATLPFDTAEGLADMAEDVFLPQLPPDESPYLDESAVVLVADGYEPAEEFIFGLDLVLAALEPLRDSGSHSRGSDRSGTVPAMTDAEGAEGQAAEKPTDPAREHTPPAGAETTSRWTGGSTPIDYTATAAWLVLRKAEKPVAEIFSVSYVADPRDEDRPVTFVFNGGPGASSAYLHLGAAGPLRVDIPADGSLPRMPPRLVQNESSWLAFSDLVFVDPVGTGFSRVIEPKEAASGKEPAAQKGAAGPDGKEFFTPKRDLESLAEFMGRWLSEHGRWGSPVLIAGESYGGYRVGRLVRMLQESSGIGLNGAILISPALELTPMSPTDYDMVGWIDTLPTMALAAALHGRARALPQGTTPDAVRAAAEAFATGPYATFLARGSEMPAVERAEVLGRLSDLLGLPQDLVTRAEGRIRFQTFARELLRDERRVVGYYDATITGPDPFPDREAFAGPDPTLAGIGATYMMAINRLLRSEIGVRTEREYSLLSYEVFTAWRDEAEQHFFEPPTGATDDFRYGMALNPHMRALITHGRHDLVTPYFATDRLRNLMRLDPAMADRLTVRHFEGGHMFYAWEASRHQFADEVARFVATAIGTTA